MRLTGLEKFTNIWLHVRASGALDCSNPVQGVNWEDCQHMARVGMAGMGDNVLEDNRHIWIGDDGPNTFQFTNKASEGPITLILCPLH